MFALKQPLAALLTATLVTVPAVAQNPVAAAPSAMEIVVNIPAGRLDVFQDGARVRSYPVSVGTSTHATPVAEASIRRMVWNPAWTPPDAEWARNQKPQAPGWSNPMGRVKMHLFDDYYIHGVPAAEERHLGHPASHGCIRMASRDAMELARLVLRADGTPVSDATVRYLARTPSATRELALAGRVHVRIEYRLADVGADSVRLLPDVYGRAGSGYAARVRDELAAAGADPSLLARLDLAPVPAPVRVPRAVPARAAVIPDTTRPSATVALPATDLAALQR